MKKSVLISCTAITAFSLMAFSFMNRGNFQKGDPMGCSLKSNVMDDVFLQSLYPDPETEILFKVDSRFLATISKQDLLHAKSIVDILPKEATQDLSLYRDVEITLLNKDIELHRSKKGEDERLNSDQIELLQSIDYSNNILVSAYCKRHHIGTDGLEYDHLTYYITICPEEETEYIGGEEALIEYFRENSKEKTTLINRNQLKPGKVRFTVTKSGLIADVELESTSGYTSLDATIIELIAAMPGKWNPAKNSLGMNIDQELVLFFGIMGC